MQMFQVDNGIRDLMSTSTAFFEQLLQSYQFRKDSPDLPDRPADPIQMLCYINRQAAKSLGLKELALTWKSLAKIAAEIKLYRAAAEIVKQQQIQQSPVTTPLQNQKTTRLAVAKSPATAGRRGDRKLERKQNGAGFTVHPTHIEESKAVHRFENDALTVVLKKKRSSSESPSSESSEDESESSIKLIKANGEPKQETDQQPNHETKPNERCQAIEV